MKKEQFHRVMWNAARAFLLCFAFLVASGAYAKSKTYSTNYSVTPLLVTDQSILPNSFETKLYKITQTLTPVELGDDGTGFLDYDNSVAFSVLITDATTGDFQMGSPERLKTISLYQKDDSRPEDSIFDLGMLIETQDVTGEGIYTLTVPNVVNSSTTTITNIYYVTVTSKADGFDVQPIWNPLIQLSQGSYPVWDTGLREANRYHISFWKWLDGYQTGYAYEDSTIKPTFQDPELDFVESGKILVDFEVLDARPTPLSDYFWLEQRESLDWELDSELFTIAKQFTNALEWVDGGNLLTRDPLYKFLALNRMAANGGHSYAYMQTQQLMPLNTPYPVLLLNMASLNSAIEGLTGTITVPATSSFNPLEDLAEIDLMTGRAKNDLPPLGLWKDSNNNGYFDAADEKVNEYSISIVGSGTTYQFEIHYLAGDAQLETTADMKVDYFLCAVARPNDKSDHQQPKYGSSFSVKLDSISHWWAKTTTESTDTSFSQDTEFYIFPNEFATSDNASVMPGTDVTIGLEVKAYGYENVIDRAADDFVEKVMDGQLVNDYTVVDPLEAEGMPVPVLALNMVDSMNAGVNETLQSITVRFASAGFKPSMLMELTDDGLSGVSLWKDYKVMNGAQVGVFDARWGMNAKAPFDKEDGRDTFVPLSTDSLKWWYFDGTTSRLATSKDAVKGSGDYFWVTLKPSEGIALPDDDWFYDFNNTTTKPGLRNLGANRGLDYFICIRSNTTMPYGQLVTAVIVPGEDLEFGYGENAVADVDGWYDDPSEQSYNPQMMVPVEATVEATVPVAFLAVDGSTVAADGYLYHGKKVAVSRVDIVSTEDSDYSFDHFSFQILDKGGFNFQDYVLSDDTGATCGIALYRDNGDGIFNESSDSRVKYVTRTSGRFAGLEKLPELKTVTISDSELYMISMDLDADSVGALAKGINTFFLVFEPTAQADAGDAIQIQYFGGDVLGDFNETISFVELSTGAVPSGMAWSNCYGRGQTGVFTVASVTSDVITDRTENGVALDFYNGAAVGTDADTSMTDALGLKSVDKLQNTSLKGMRIYYQADRDIAPYAVINEITGSKLDGLQIWRDGAQLPVKAAEWKFTGTDARVDFLSDVYTSATAGIWACAPNVKMYYNADEDAIWYSSEATGDTDTWTGSTAQVQVTTAAIPSGTVGVQMTDDDNDPVFRKIVDTDNIIWYDTDGDTKWSEGDHLWWTLNVSDGTADAFNMDDGNHVVLAGDPENGMVGKLVTTDTYGFAFSYDSRIWDGVDFNPIVMTTVLPPVYFVGAGNTALGWYIDLELQTPSLLPASATGDVFTVKVKMQDDNVNAFGRIPFSLGLTYNSMTYANSETTFQSLGSANVVTKNITCNYPVAVISDLKAEQNEDGEFTISWKNTGVENQNVMIVRAETDELETDYPAIFDAYPLNQTWYEVGDFLTLYEASGSTGDPDEAFNKDGSGFYVVDATEAPSTRVKVMYIGKGEFYLDRMTFKDTTTVNGKYYYYAAFAADVLNSYEQGTPNSDPLASSQNTASAMKGRDQMIEALNANGEFGELCVSSKVKPNPVTDYVDGLNGLGILLNWTNPTHLSNGTTAFTNGNIILLRSKTAVYDPAFVDGLAPTAQTLDSNLTLLSADLTLDDTVYLDTKHLEEGSVYYYYLYAYNPSTMLYSDIVVSEGIVFETRVRPKPLEDMRVDASFNLYWTNPVSMDDETEFDADANGKIVILRSESEIVDGMLMDGATPAVDDVLGDGSTVVAVLSPEGGVLATTWTDDASSLDIDKNYFYAAYIANTDEAFADQPIWSKLEGAIFVAAANPGNVTKLIATPNESEKAVALTWVNPETNSLGNALVWANCKIVIIRGTSATWNYTVTDGEMPATQEGYTVTLLDGNQTSYNDTSVLNNVMYYYNVYVLDMSNGNNTYSTVPASATAKLGVPDADGDGMPNDWEIAYGTNPEDASDKYEDLNGDGLNNWYTYLLSAAVYSRDGVLVYDFMPEDDWDEDGISNEMEQVFGTDPTNADTDDDGVSDATEISTEGERDPLMAERGSDDYYVALPENGTVVYLDWNDNYELGTVAFSADFRLQGVESAVTLASYGDKLVISMEADGRITATAGNVSATTQNSYNEEEWTTVSVTLQSVNLTLAVGDEIVKAVYGKKLGLTNGAALTLGALTNTALFGVDNLAFNAGDFQIASDFNDFGATFENTLGPKLEYAPETSFLNSMYAGTASVSATFTQEQLLAATPEQPVMHQWLTLRGGETGWSGMEVAIETLYGEAEAAFNPAEENFDQLTGKVTEDTSAVLEKTINYSYFWFAQVWDDLSFKDGAFTSMAGTPEVLSTGSVLNLANYADLLAAGDTLQLAVVALDAETNAFVDMATATIVLSDTVVSEEESLSIPSGTTAWKGETVTLKTSESGVDVELYWYCNGLPYGTDKQTASGTKVSFKLPSGASVRGDAWSYHAWILDENGKRVSRMFPELGEEDYTLIGSPWTDKPTTSVDEDVNDASSIPPSMPTKVTITPESPNLQEMLIASASGSSSQYHSYYVYQWYLNGYAIIGATQPYYYPNAETDGDQVISVGAKAVNIYGAESAERMSQPVLIRSSTLVAGSIYRIHEPNDMKSQATFVAPKGNFYDLTDPNIQEHYLYTDSDTDWFYFVVPNNMRGKKKVIFETNNGNMWEYALGTMDGPLDNTLLLYNENGKLISTVDDYVERVGNTTYETKYARFEKELEPGIYYVRISLGNRGGTFYVDGSYYQVHLGIFDIATTQGPSYPSSVKLTPMNPGSADSLVCTASGARSSSGEEITGEGSNGSEGYYYVWYRNGELVGFGNTSTIEMWSTGMYEYLQAKNFSSSKTEAASVIPAEYTKKGDIWYCVVYAKDDYGLSYGMASNMVLISSTNADEADWSMQLLGVTNNGSGAVSSQNLEFGWNAKATNAYDSACDIQAPGDNLGGANAVDFIGFDNGARRLVKDIRPYGTASAWFVTMEFNDTDTSGSLTWNTATLPEAASATSLTVTAVTADKNGTYQPTGAAVDMTTASSISLTQQEIAQLPRNARGFRYAVFRISVGEPDYEQTILLKEGWNLVSFPVKPASISENIWDGNDWVDGFEVLEFYNEKGKTGYRRVEDKDDLEACTGYWIKAPNDAVLTFSGSAASDVVKLSAGWNLIGVSHDIADFKTTYSSLWTETNQIVDPDNILTYEDGSYKLIGMSGTYPMTTTKAYWVYAAASAELDMSAVASSSTPDTEEEDDEEGGDEE